MLDCQHCGNRLQPGGLFCPECGTPVASAAPTLAGDGRTTSVYLTGSPDPAPARPAGTGPIANAQAGDRRVVTVLFAEIPEMKVLRLTLDPEEESTLINQLFDVVTEAIYRFGGRVDKYIGDVVMAVFGAPMAHEDDAERALWAAWEMREGVRRLSAELKGHVGIEVNVRVGLNTGLVMAGNVGGDHKRDYTVLGDAVNLAQRMEANAPVGGILVTEETRRLAAEAFRFDAGGTIKVKNREQPVDAYQLLGPAVPPPAAPVRLAGRRQEAAALLETWSVVRDGGPALVLVEGEGGLGKTSLLRHGAGTFRRTGLLVWARCASFESEVPLSLAAALLRSLLDLDLRARPEGDNGRAADLIAGALGERWPERGTDPEIRAAFEFLLTGQVGAGLAGLSAEHRRTIVFRHLHDFVLARARAAPLALVIDDVQWCDDGSRAWLNSLLPSLARTGARVLVALSSRPQGFAGLEGADEARVMAPASTQAVPAEPEVAKGQESRTPAGPPAMPSRRIVLAPLPESEARELLRLEFGDEAFGELPADLLDRLLVRGGGNPLVLTALARSVQRGNDNGVLDAEPLPLMLMGYFQAKLDVLPLTESGRQVLEAAAVLGTVVSTRRLEQLTDPEIVPLATAELCRAGILTPGEAGESGGAAGRPVGQQPDAAGTYAFFDPLLRDAIYERLLLRRRRELHARVADLHEADGEPPAVVAEHRALSDEPAKAAAAYLAAAERSLSYHSSDEALRHATVAQEWAAKAEGGLPEDFATRCNTVLAEVHATIGNLDRALDAADQLVAMASGDEIVPAYDRTATLLVRMGRLEEALDRCARGLALADDHDPRRAWLLVRQSQVRLERGQFAGVAQEAAGVLAVASVQEPRLRAELQWLVGVAETHIGRLDLARRALERAMRSFKEAGDLGGLARSLYHLGLVCSLLGDDRNAPTSCTQGLRFASRLEDQLLLSRLFNLLGEIYQRQGEANRAQECFLKALEAHRRAGVSRDEGAALCNLGAVAMNLGNCQAAVKHLHNAVRALQQAGRRGAVGEAFLLLGRAHLADGRYSEALEVLHGAAVAALDTGQQRLQGESLRLQGEVLGRMARLDDALPRAACAVQILKEIHAPVDLGNAYTTLGRVLGDLGRHKQAAEAMAEAEAAFASAGAEPAGSALAPAAPGV